MDAGKGREKVKNMDNSVPSAARFYLSILLYISCVLITTGLMAGAAGELIIKGKLNYYYISGALSVFVIFMILLNLFKKIDEKD